MISRVLAYSPNFAGNVKIGKNREERRQIAKDILKLPENSREYFIDSINSARAILASRTSKNVNLTMHLENYNGENGRFQGVAVDVTDEGVGSAVVVGKSVSMNYVFDGEKNEYFKMDIDDRFSELQDSVLKSVSVVNIPKQPEGLPKTVEDVLNRLA